MNTFLCPRFFYVVLICLTLENCRRWRNPTDASDEFLFESRYATVAPIYPLLRKEYARQTPYDAIPTNDGITRYYHVTHFFHVYLTTYFFHFSVSRDKWGIQFSTLIIIFCHFRENYHSARNFTFLSHVAFCEKFVILREICHCIVRNFRKM